VSRRPARQEGARLSPSGGKCRSAPYREALSSPEPQPRLCVATLRHPEQEEAFRPPNPGRLCPLLADGDCRLRETDAIACYLLQRAESGFWRQGARRWRGPAGSAGDPSPYLAVPPIYFDRIVRPTFATERTDPAAIAAAFADWRTFMAMLNDHLDGRDFGGTGR